MGWVHGQGTGPESLCLPRIKDPGKRGADRMGRGKVSQIRPSHQALVRALSPRGKGGVLEPHIACWSLTTICPEVV